MTSKDHIVIFNLIYNFVNLEALWIKEKGEFPFNGKYYQHSVLFSIIRFCVFNFGSLGST